MIYVRFMCGLCVVLCAACTPQIRYRTVEVPVTVSCVAHVPAKPSRLTPCPPSVTDSQCVTRAAVDIERLDSALDQSLNLLEACK